MRLRGAVAKIRITRAASITRALGGIADLLTSMPQRNSSSRPAAAGRSRWRSCRRGRIARFSKTFIQPIVCLPGGKWVAHRGIDGQTLKEFAQGPTRSGKQVTMDLKDRRLWYGVVAVIVVLVVIAYAAGWFGGTPIPAPQQ